MITNYQTLKNDAFRLLDGYVVLDALASETSFDEVVRIAAELIAKEHPYLQKEQVEELARLHVKERTDDEIVRHGAPFFTEEIRRDLHRMGYRFSDTQEEELIDYMSPFADVMSRMIRKFGVDKVASRICNAELFDSSYSGNFSGYDPAVTASALKKLAATVR